MKTFYRQKATKTASYIRKEAVYINILIISIMITTKLYLLPALKPTRQFLPNYTGLQISD